MNIQSADSKATILALDLLSPAALSFMQFVALIAMTLDHINKWIYSEEHEALFIVGRMAFPLFSMVFSFKMASADDPNVYMRVAKRLLLWGSLAEIPFIALGGLAWGWYPMNILFAFLIATISMYFFSKGGLLPNSIALIVILLGGTLVEFWWPGVIMIVSLWAFFRSDKTAYLLFYLLSFGFLYFINRNVAALYSLIVVAVSVFVPYTLRYPKHFLYYFYVSHLTVILLIVKCIS